VNIGIVGSEAAKFTPATERKAREFIRSILRPGDVVHSGECHLGGIDIWAREEAERAGNRFVPHPPKNLRWSDGYMPRNLEIARESDVLVCITLRTLPEGYTGMRFKVCYHHDPPATDHVKSGGCWTMKQAALMGKKTHLEVIE
jgi:hypothetical protein